MQKSQRLAKSKTMYKHLGTVTEVFAPSFSVCFLIIVTFQLRLAWSICSLGLSSIALKIPSVTPESNVPVAS